MAPAAETPRGRHTPADLPHQSAFPRTVTPSGYDTGHQGPHGASGAAAPAGSDGVGHRSGVTGDEQKPPAQPFADGDDDPSILTGVNPADMDDPAFMRKVEAVANRLRQRAGAGVPPVLGPRTAEEMRNAAAEEWARATAGFLPPSAFPPLPQAARHPPVVSRGQQEAGVKRRYADALRAATTPRPSQPMPAPAPVKPGPAPQSNVPQSSGDVLDSKHEPVQGAWDGWMRSQAPFATPRAPQDSSWPAPTASAFTPINMHDESVSDEDSEEELVVVAPSDTRPRKPPKTQKPSKVTGRKAKSQQRASRHQAKLAAEAKAADFVETGSTQSDFAVVYNASRRGDSASTVSVPTTVADLTDEQKVQWAQRGPVRTKLTITKMIPKASYAVVRRKYPTWDLVPMEEPIPTHHFLAAVEREIVEAHMLQLAGHPAKAVVDVGGNPVRHRQVRQGLEPYCIFPPTEAGAAVAGARANQMQLMNWCACKAEAHFDAPLSPDCKGPRSFDSFVCNDVIYYLDADFFCSLVCRMRDRHAVAAFHLHEDLIGSAYGGQYKWERSGDSVQVKVRGDSNTRTHTEPLWLYDGSRVVDVDGVRFKVTWITTNFGEFTKVAEFVAAPLVADAVEPPEAPPPEIAPASLTQLLASLADMRAIGPVPFINDDVNLFSERKYLRVTVDGESTLVPKTVLATAIAYAAGQERNATLLKALKRVVMSELVKDATLNDAHRAAATPTIIALAFYMPLSREVDVYLRARRFGSDLVGKHGALVSGKYKSWYERLLEAAAGRIGELSEQLGEWRALSLVVAMVMGGAGYAGFRLASAIYAPRAAPAAARVPRQALVPPDIAPASLLDALLPPPRISEAISQATEPAVTTAVSWGRAALSNAWPSVTACCRGTWDFLTGLWAGYWAGGRHEPVPIGASMVSNVAATTGHEFGYLHAVATGVSPTPPPYVGLGGSLFSVIRHVLVATGEEAFYTVLSGTSTQIAWITRLLHIGLEWLMAAARRSWYGPALVVHLACQLFHTLQLPSWAMYTHVLFNAAVAGYDIYRFARAAPARLLNPWAAGSLLDAVPSWGAVLRLVPVAIAVASVVKVVNAGIVHYKNMCLQRRQAEARRATDHFNALRMAVATDEKEFGEVCAVEPAKPLPQQAYAVRTAPTLTRRYPSTQPVAIPTGLTTPMIHPIVYTRGPDEEELAFRCRLAPQLPPVAGWLSDDMLKGGFEDMATDLIGGQAWRTLHPTDYEVWLARFEGPRRKMLDNAYVYGHDGEYREIGRTLRCKVFQKTELLNKLDYTDDCEWWEPRIDLGAPRIIQNTPERLVVFAGPWMHAAFSRIKRTTIRLLKRDELRANTFASGLSTEQLGYWFLLALKRGRASPHEVCVDLADATLFDVHCVGEYQDAKLHAYEQVWAVPHAVCQCLDKQTRVTAVGNFGTRVTVQRGMTNTGSVDTSGGGSTIAAGARTIALRRIASESQLAACSALHQADDMLGVVPLALHDRLYDVLSAMGFTYKPERLPLSDAYRAVFCQMRPWPTHDGKIVFGPKAGRVLARFGLSLSFVKAGRRVARFRGVCLSLHKRCHHVPFLREAIEWGLERTAGVTPEFTKELREIRFEADDEHDYTDVNLNIGGVTWPNTWEMLWGLYGLTRDDLRDFQERLRALDASPAVLNHPALEVLAAVDCA